MFLHVCPRPWLNTGVPGALTCACLVPPQRVLVPVCVGCVCDVM